MADDIEDAIRIYWGKGKDKQPRKFQKSRQQVYDFQAALRQRKQEVAEQPRTEIADGGKKRKGNGKGGRRKI